MSERIKLEGKAFGFWRVLNYIDNQHNHSFYNCVCVCGVNKRVSGNYLKSGRSKSCGCRNLETITLKLNTTSRPHWVRLRSVWSGMTNRCYRSTNERITKNYRDKGIAICDEWLSDFERFYQWARRAGYKPGLQIDRINPNGHYEPSNCRFVTALENTRAARCNRFRTRDGKVIIGNAALASRHGRSVSWVKTRLRRGRFSELEIEITD